MTELERSIGRSIFSAAERLFHVRRFRQIGRLQSGVHPLKGLWLTRDSLVDEKPYAFKSVMDQVDKNEARRVVSAAKKKFDGNYLEYRARVEAWMRTEIRNAGGNIDDSVSPLYFTLNLGPAANTHRKDFFTINIPADSISVDKLSFTIGDSFHNYELMDPLRKHKFPLEGPPVLRVFNAHEMRKMIDGEDFTSLLDRRGVRFIEAQVWAAQDLPAFARVRAMLAKGETPQ